MSSFLIRVCKFDPNMEILWAMINIPTQNSANIHHITSYPMKVKISKKVGGFSTFYDVHTPCHVEVIFTYPVRTSIKLSFKKISSLVLK